MPAFRLLSNTRSWPKSNLLYLYVAGGEFTRNADGEINSSPNVNTLWRQKKVSRKSVKDQKWKGSGTSFIWSNWLQSQQELRIIVDYKKGSRDHVITGKVKIDSDGDFNSDTEATFTTNSDGAKGMFNVAFDRCSTLASITSDGGDGKRENLRIYRFGELLFTLKPVIKE